MPQTTDPDPARPRLEHGAAPDLEPDDFDELEGASVDAEPSRRFDSALLREPVSVLPVRRPLVFSRDATVAEAVRAMQREHRGTVLVTADGTPASRSSASSPSATCCAARSSAASISAPCRSARS